MVNGEHPMLEILILAMNGGQDILKDKSVINGNKNYHNNSFVQWGNGIKKISI